MSKSFDRLATVTAGTKRPPTQSGGIEAAAAVNLAGVKCTPLDPMADSQEIKGIEPGAHLLVTFVGSGLDISEGDLLTAAGVDYPIRQVRAWTWGGGSYLRLVVEKLRV